MVEKKMTGYPSIDKPWCADATFFRKHPIIPNVSIYMLFRLISLKILDQPAIDCLNIRATYRQLIKDAVTISVALKELGVKKGDIVSVAMPNMYQGLTIFFGCNRIGAVVTFLDVVASTDEIISYLNQFKSPVLVAFDKSNDYLDKVKQSTQVEHIITMGPDDLNTIEFKVDPKVSSADDVIPYSALGQFSANASKRLIPAYFNVDDALILYTSGSTGKPKSVVLTNKNIVAAELYLKNSCRMEITGTKTLTCVPFSYPYGFITSALTSLMWGKETILAPNMSKDTISYYYAKAPNIIFGSPALLDLTINNISELQDLSSVTHFISGGDFLTVQHAARGDAFFTKHGASNVEIGNGCGNAETVSVGANPVGIPLKTGTAGKFLTGIDVMVVDPDTFEEKRYGEEGLLCVSGKHIFKEYYHNPQLTSEVKFIRNQKEYYITGTLGTIDEDGYFTVTGRQSRFYIMSSLNKVYCDYVQGIIGMFDCVKDCAVVKVPDAELLYVNKAYIVLNEPYTDSDETMALLQNCLHLSTVSAAGNTVQLKPYEMPTYIEFVESLPRMPGSEKIDYLLLEKQAQESLA